MRADTVVVVGVTSDRLTQMLLAQNDHVIETLSADRTNDTLRERVLPRRGRGCENLLQTGRFDFSAEELTKLPITISYQLLRRRIEPNSLDNLSRRPLRRRRLSYIGVQDLPPIVTENHQDE